MWSFGGGASIDCAGVAPQRRVRESHRRGPGAAAVPVWEATAGGEAAEAAASRARVRVGT